MFFFLVAHILKITKKEVDDHDFKSLQSDVQKAKLCNFFNLFDDGNPTAGLKLG